ncbi:YesL family protein [Pseudalkalibacillus salsuginis]|uniref:YesL family protein n=1 Tax=Pseudalkalibacillus salsuginis TaxID=2910972 RepID=UPI003899982B
MYRFIDRLSQILLLNILWIITCLPIITIFPSTYAMFGVVRQWTLKNEINIFSAFWTYFKENFKQCILLGFVWTITVSILLMNLSLSFRMPYTFLKIVTTSVLALMIFLFIITSIYIFPVLVQYKAKWYSIIRNSFLFSVGQISISLVNIIIVVISLIIISYMPISFLFIGGLSSYSIYYLCNKSFYKLKKIKKDKTPDEKILYT